MGFLTSVKVEYLGDAALGVPWTTWAKQRFFHLEESHKGCFQKTLFPVDGVRIDMVSSGGVGRIRIWAEGGGHGIVFRPVSDAAPYGWGRPVTDDNRPLGTPMPAIAEGSVHNRPFWRVSPIHFKDGRYKDTKTTRRFMLKPQYGNLDWVWRKADGTPKAYVTWMSPSGRSAIYQTTEVELSGYVHRRPGSALDGSQEPVLSGGGGTFRPYSFRRDDKVFMNGKAIATFTGDVHGAAVRKVGSTTYVFAVVAPSFRLPAFGVDPATAQFHLTVCEINNPASPHTVLATWTMPSGYEYAETYKAHPMFDWFFNKSATECVSLIPATQLDSVGNPAQSGAMLVKFTAISPTAATIETTPVNFGGSVSTTPGDLGPTADIYGNGSAASSGSNSGSGIFAVDYKGDTLVTATFVFSASSSATRNRTTDVVTNPNPEAFPYHESDIGAMSASYSYSASGSITYTLCGKSLTASRTVSVVSSADWSANNPSYTYIPSATAHGSPSSVFNVGSVTQVPNEEGELANQWELAGETQSGSESSSSTDVGVAFLYIDLRNDYFIATKYTQTTSGDRVYTDTEIHDYLFGNDRNQTVITGGGAEGTGVAGESGSATISDYSDSTTGVFDSKGAVFSANPTVLGPTAPMAPNPEVVLLVPDSEAGLWSFWPFYNQRYVFETNPEWPYAGNPIGMVDLYMVIVPSVAALPTGEIMASLELPQPTTVAGEYSPTRMFWKVAYHRGNATVDPLATANLTGGNQRYCDLGVI